MRKDVGRFRRTKEKDFVFTIEVKMSPSEKDFIQLRYGQMLSLKEVADKMGISHRNVRLVSVNVMRKLHIPRSFSGATTSVIMATRIFLKAGMIEL